MSEEAVEQISTAPEGEANAQTTEPVSTAPDAPDFLANLPDDIKAEPSLQKYKTAEDFVTGFLEAQRRLGRSITVPGEDATDEQRQEFYEKLTNNAPELAARITPDSPEAYALPEGIEADDSVLRAIALDAKLTNEQYGTIMSKFYEQEQANQQEAVAQFNESVKALHDEWGAAYDDRYQQAYAMAREMGKRGANNDHELFAQGVASPNTVKSYFELAQMVGSEGVNLQTNDVVSDRKTPAEIEARVKEINKILMSNQLPPSDPEYKALMEEKRALYKQKPGADKPVDPGYRGAGIGGLQFR
jgi:hypothetical protein